MYFAMDWCWCNYLLSFLHCAKYTTVVCDQIANKSFVLLNASILGEYRKKPSLQSASHARRQERVTGGGGGHKQTLGGHKKLNTSNPRVWIKKKVLISKNAQIFTNYGVKPQKKGLYYKICKKTVLAHEFWGNNQYYLGSLRPRTALQWHPACYFLWEQVSLGGHNSCLGGTSSDLGRHSPGMPPVASGLLQVYSNLSNCNYRIFVKEIRLKIGFIEEMRTIWGKKEMPQTFFHNFLYLRKYDFIRLTSYHCQPCIQYGYGIHILATPKLRQADTSPRQTTFFHFKTLQTLRQL